MGEFLITLFGVGGLLTVIVLSMSLIGKMEKIREAQSKADNLQKSLNEMDEQAKLIIRTDLELNKTQEELDKKMHGLYALQKVSQAISITLEEGEIFKNIEEYILLPELGFEKMCCFMWNSAEKKFTLKVSIGFPGDEASEVRSKVDIDKTDYLSLIERGKTTSSVSSATEQTAEQAIRKDFNLSSFIIAPILSKEANKGFLFIGTNNMETTINEGDEELITILANQLAQALDNARLFEQIWNSQQELEKKVEVRTHQLSLALEEVKKISNRKSDFVSSVSHELRTPLTAIKGYAAILISGKLGAIPEEARQRLEKINLRSDELVGFINDLLDISRIESGRVPMKTEPVDLKNTVDEIADILAPLMKEKQIEFSTDVPAGLVVHADYGQIKRVFINLINNALKYTPPKGKISVSVKKMDKEVQVDIADTGCGIPEEAQAKLFQEFYRVDSTINEEVKGTGLGLALVKNIIEAHKGKIWLKSQVGVGSTFRFSLPL